MFKNILIFVFVFYTCVNGYCQFSTGVISYKTSVESNKRKSENLKIADLIEKIEKKSNDLNFILKFSDDNKTSFCPEEKLKTDTNEEDELTKKLALLKISPYIYFNDFTNLERILVATDGTLIKKEIIKSNWELINETKMIDKFLCFKAISTKTIINRNGEEKDLKIIAWYAPSIPVPFGPMDYFGLPGLILEIQERNFTLVASSIFFSEKEIKIDFPKGKAITQEEYERKILSGN